MKSLVFFGICVLLTAACGDDSAAAGDGTGGGGDGGAPGGGGDGGAPGDVASSSTGQTSTTTTSTSAAGGGGSISSCDVAEPAARAATCEVYASAVCDFYERCGVGVVALLWGSVDVCAATIGATCREQRHVEESRYLGCLEAIASSLEGTCDASPAATSVGDACAPQGTLADGEICDGHADCASGYCKTTATSCATCAPGFEVGDPCHQLGCGPRLACVDGTCREPPREGDPCPSSTTLCDDGSVCFDGLCQRGTPSGDGEPCDDTRWCDVSQDLVCVEGTCVPFEPSDAGLQESCERTTASLFGIPFEGDLCAEGLICSQVGARVCVPAKLPGEACTSDEQCTTYECIDGVCNAGPVCTCNE